MINADMCCSLAADRGASAELLLAVAHSATICKAVWTVPAAAYPLSALTSAADTCSRHLQQPLTCGLACRLLPLKLQFAASIVCILRASPLGSALGQKESLQLCLPGFVRDLAGNAHGPPDLQAEHGLLLTVPSGQIQAMIAC